MYISIVVKHVRILSCSLPKLYKQRVFNHVIRLIQRTGLGGPLTKLGLARLATDLSSTHSRPPSLHRLKTQPFEGRCILGRLSDFRSRPRPICSITSRTLKTTSIDSSPGEMSHTDTFLQKRNKRKTQKQDAKIKGTSVVGNFSLQVIGTGSLECPPSILVIADSSRYLFNCGEGTQRLLMENGVKNLSRLENIFLTRMTWDNIGGLIGLTITLKNVGLPKVHYHGPPNMKSFVDALQIFAKHEEINIGLRPYTEGVFTTDVMTVNPVAIFGNPSKSTETPCNQEDNPMTSDKVHRTLTTEQLDEPMNSDTVHRTLTTEQLDRPLTSSTSVDGMKYPSNAVNNLISEMAVKSLGVKIKKSVPNLTVAYICKVHRRQRNMIVKKALALGLPPGPKYTDLKKGLTVMTDDGREVHPDDVLGPDVPNYSFIVLQCPSVDYLDSLFSNEDIKRCQAGESSTRLIVHMTPTDVLQHPKYKEWMQGFDPATEHVILNQCQASASHESARGLQAKLNLLHSDIFPLLPEPSWKEFALSEGLNIIKGETYLRYHFWPDTGLDRGLVSTLSIEPYVSAARSISNFCESLEITKVDLARTLSHSKKKKYPEVQFLGTGSAMPNKERNVSCILLNLCENQTMIMDAGEGSFAQLCRFYGDQVDDVLFKLQCVFISHIHADHHVGLVQILRHWTNIMKERGADDRDLLLVGPKRLLIWLNQYNRNCENIIHKVRFIELADFCKTSENISRHGQVLLKKLHLTKFETVRVIHCANAYGVAITHQDGWKIVYSGDTMPCKALVEAGIDADLLVHEATLEDGMKEDASMKRHSMTSEAIDIGVQMRAKFIILTHFSQRYSKIPLFSDQFSEKVAVAFDNMKVSLSDVHLLPKLIPAMKSLFAHELQELEELREKKIEKRTIPEDLQRSFISKKQKCKN